MKYTSAVLALAAGASAHTLMSEIYIDGAGQGSGTCVRTPHNAKGAVDPIIDLSSKDMACGQDGEYGVARTCPMSGGQQLTFEYRQWPDDAPRASIAMGHMGPCAVYLKKVDDATKAGASGDGWFKLWDEGLDGSGQWCTNKRVTESNGHLSVTIPDSLPGGDYLVRPELLALHNIPEKHQPEFYVGCAQVFLKSSGNSGPKSTVSIPGYVDGSESGLTYNPFNKPLKDYEVPGPKVYTPSSGGVSVMKNMKQSDGLGEGCIVTNNNWCAKELPSYSDEDGCWDADKNCWDQLDKCYDEAGAVGLVGCKTWEKYCKDNQSNCKSGNSGPPSAQNLDSDHKTIETPASANGGMSYGSSGSSSGSDDSSSNNEQSSSSNSADDYKKKEVKAPSYDNSNNNDNSQEESAAPAPQQTSAPAPEQYKPSSKKAEAPATTLVTKAKTQDNVVYETVYETVNAYATVTDVAYATETVQAYRRHAHPRHAAAH